MIIVIYTNGKQNANESLLRIKNTFLDRFMQSKNIIMTFQQLFQRRSAKVERKFNFLRLGFQWNFRFIFLITSDRKVYRNL